MITGFSYDTSNGNWYADYNKNNKGFFKQIYKNQLGYFIIVAGQAIYLTAEQEKEFKKVRKAVLKQMAEA